MTDQPTDPTAVCDHVVTNEGYCTCREHHRRIGECEHLLRELRGEITNVLVNYPEMYSTTRLNISMNRLAEVLKETPDESRAALREKR